jgi:IclR family transcriptional regulator, pca regulon regulatory protein
MCSFTDAHNSRRLFARQTHRLRDNRAMLVSSTRPKTVATADWIEGAAKSFAVLESFSAERQRLSVTQIAERAGLTRAAARRHVLTLQALGYLEAEQGTHSHMRSPSYWLTHRVLRLAGNYLASARLPRVVQPMLSRLAAQTGQAFSVAVLDGAQAVIVARSGEHRMASAAMPYGVNLGARLAAFATSTGRVLLAQLTPTQLKAHLAQHERPKLTSHTITSAPQLRRLIQEAGQQGYSEVHQEHELGVYALAIPLHDAQNRVVAAMNLVLTNAKHQPPRSGDALQKAYLAHMREAAGELRLLL